MPRAEGWKAAWLLAHKLGPEETVIRELSGRLQTGGLHERMLAAITLCLMDRHEAVPFLLGLIESREPVKLSDHPKCVPLWVAAFVLLRLIKSKAALRHTLTALEEMDATAEVRIPEEASLAYIADIPWKEPADACGLTTDKELPMDALLVAGEAASRPAVAYSRRECCDWSLP
jgi:hypothetical protein